MGPKWGPNRIFDAEASEYLLGASWIALGALRSRKKVIGIGSWAAKRRTKTRFQPTRGIRSVPPATPPSKPPPMLAKASMLATSSGGALSVIRRRGHAPLPDPPPMLAKASMGSTSSGSALSVILGLVARPPLVTPLVSPKGAPYCKQLPALLKRAFRHPRFSVGCCY